MTFDLNGCVRYPGGTSSSRGNLDSLVPLGGPRGVEFVPFIVLLRVKVELIRRRKNKEKTVAVFRCLAVHVDAK